VRGDFSNYGEAGCHAQDAHDTEEHTLEAYGTEEHTLEAYGTEERWKRMRKSMALI
jgi:hypothetical protein